jgi:hypothetical protein
MKITIETDGATVQTVQPVQPVQPAAEVSGAAGAAPSQAGVPATGGGVSLSDLLAKAASLGAQNAGPAPSPNDAAMGPAPIAASVGGAPPEASMLTASAGSPPPHVYGSTGGCK